jgi:hypothetical protein
MIGGQGDGGRVCDRAPAGLRRPNNVRLFPMRFPMSALRWHRSMIAP